MKTVLFAVVFVFGLTCLAGCSDSSSGSAPPAAQSNGAPPAKDSGSGAKKGPRIPGPAAPK